MSKVKDHVDEIMSSGKNNTIDFEEFKAWGMRSPFINLFDEDEEDHKVYLTMSGWGSAVNALLTHDKLEVKLLSGHGITALLAGGGGEKKKGEQPLVWCRMMYKSREDGNVISFETKALPPGQCKWNESFVVDLVKVDMDHSEGVTVHVLAKYGSDAEEEHVIGEFTLDWKYIEKNIGPEVEYGIAKNQIQVGSPSCVKCSLSWN
eukprot:CAMPEP_0119138430 /NCGR_PEP_ID=MMETSP1310-20130426/25633_1 /TAXON_ID=464262 /ORGANISM="Genus nov. species nov., Strain RCC2339" /LENGTH=204 /DNA_ID=CAMNT_0007129621 /DNA_START=30 /DNA_END=644 /DNA_ORIENTATION=-